MKVEESRKEMEDWFKELLSYVRGKIWNTGGIWVCESHPLMPHEQGLSFDCKCGGGVGMPPIRIKGHRGIPIRHGKMPVIPDDCPVCGSPLEENDVCSDMGYNNCQYVKGM